MDKKFKINKKIIISVTPKYLIKKHNSKIGIALYLSNF